MKVISSTGKAYYRPSKDKTNRYQKKYREERISKDPSFKQRLRQHNRNSYKKHREANLLWMKEYRQNNKEKIRADNKRWRENNFLKNKFNSLKGSAKRRNILFYLTFEDLLLLPLPEKCPVLGIPLDWSSKDNVPSIDRIDNTLPYQKGNVVWISHRANRLKGDATLDELVAVAGFYLNLEENKQ